MTREEQLRIFSQRLTYAMDYNHITISELSRKTGIPKTNISQYRHGVYLCKSDAIILISRALNINPAWLIGGDVTMELEVSNPSHRDADIIEMFTSLSEEKKDQARSYIKWLKENEQNK